MNMTYNSFNLIKANTQLQLKVYTDFGYLFWEQRAASSSTKTDLYATSFFRYGLTKIATNGKSFYMSQPNEFCAL